MNKEKKEKPKDEAVKEQTEDSKLTEDELDQVSGGIKRHRDDITTPEI